MVNKTDEIFTRLYELGGVKNDAGLAKILNVSPQAIANTRKRGGVPYEKICAFAQEHDLSVDYILFGGERNTELNADNEKGMPPEGLEKYARTAVMSYLLYDIFQELDKEFYLSHQMNEEKPFWLMASVYQNVLDYMGPDKIYLKKEESLLIAKHFVKEEIKFQEHNLEIARKNTEKKPKNPEEKQTGSVSQTFNANVKQVGAGDIHNHGKKK